MALTSKADNTRIAILKKALPLVYKKGYQATSIDEIIATTTLTKGAFYYHFKNKDEMGLAMIKEVFYQAMDSNTLKPLDPAKEPSSQIYGMMKELLKNESFFTIEYGCPVVNLIEEMAPLNTKFAGELRKIFTAWKKTIIDYLDAAKDLKTIKSNVDNEQVAIFVLAGYNGVRNLGKILGKASYTSYLKELKNYLKTIE